LDNRFFGHYIRDFRAGRGLPRRAKFSALLLLWSTIGATLVLYAGAGWWLRLLLVGVAVGVTVYLARLPVRPQLPS